MGWVSFDLNRTRWISPWSQGFFPTLYQIPTLRKPSISFSNDNTVRYTVITKNHKLHCLESKHHQPWNCSLLVYAWAEYWKSRRHPSKKNIEQNKSWEILWTVVTINIRRKEWRILPLIHVPFQPCLVDTDLCRAISGKFSRLLWIQVLVLDLENIGNILSSGWVKIEKESSNNKAPPMPKLRVNDDVKETTTSKKRGQRRSRMYFALP